MTTSSCLHTSRHHQTKQAASMGPRTTRKNRVRFSENSQLYLIDNLRSHALRYSPEDIQLMKTLHLRSIIRARMQLSSSLNDRLSDSSSSSQSDPQSSSNSRDCTDEIIVGIEKHLSLELSLEHKRRKREVFAAVTIEQQWQRQYLSSPNPERLAFASSSLSNWAMGRAQLAALFLQQDVMNSEP